MTAESHDQQQQRESCRSEIVATALVLPSATATLFESDLEKNKYYVITIFHIILFDEIAYAVISSE